MRPVRQQQQDDAGRQRRLCGGATLLPLLAVYVLALIFTGKEGFGEGEGFRCPCLHSLLLLRSHAGLHSMTLHSMTSHHGIRRHTPRDAATAHSWTGRLHFSSSSLEFTSE